LLVIVENDDPKIARSFLAPLGALIDLMISANHLWWLAEKQQDWLCIKGA
jgi:hypothetical protein